MKLTTPYQYSELKRKSVEGKRLYENPFGGPVPSVTTVLDKTKPEETRKALANWRNNVGAETAQRITTEAADNGSKMHDILESWLKGIPHTGQSTLLSKMMANVIKENVQDHIDEVWGIEVNLCYPELYAGTTDLVGVWKGKPCIMDHKQSNKTKKREWIDDYFIQGAAYALAHNELYGTNIRNIAIFMCTRDCKFQLFECDEDEFSKWEMEWALRLSKYYDLLA